MGLKRRVLRVVLDWGPICLDIDDESLQEEHEDAQILYWFPSTFVETISYPIDQIIELVVNNLGIEDGGNLVLRSIFKFDRGWRWFDTTWDSAVLIGF